MSNAAPERETGIDPARTPEDESTWFERLLQTFGLGDEPDLRSLIESALTKSKSDALSAQERSMMLRILRFGTLTVEDVMVPRADIVAVDDSISIEELLRVFRKVRAQPRSGLPRNPRRSARYDPHPRSLPS